MFDWGPNDWGKGKHFSFGITRQLIQDGDEDRAIYQLHFTFEFPTSAATDTLDSGNQWCHAPTKVDAFLKSIQTIPAYKNAAQRSDGTAKLEFENAE